MKTRRGQTRLESILALAFLIIAIGGAWILYRDQIMETVRRMIDG